MHIVVTAGELHTYGDDLKYEDNLKYEIERQPKI